MCLLDGSVFFFLLRSPVPLFHPRFHFLIQSTRANDAQPKSTTNNDPADVMRLRDEVARLTTQLQEKSRVTDQQVASTQTPMNDQSAVVLTVQVVSSFVSSPFMR